MTVAAVVLAAGAGSRFRDDVGAGDDGGPGDGEPGDDVGAGPRRGGAHKLTSDFRGRPLVQWAVEAALGAGFNQVYLVTGAVDLGAEVADLAADGRGVTVVENPAWAEGQATSLAAAVDVARRDGHRAIVVGLADQPLIPASAWRSVGAAAGDVVTATFDGARRPPVKFERTVWDLLPDTGDEGARSLFRRRPELVSELACSGSPIDIDTQEDLRRWS